LVEADALDPAWSAPSTHLWLGADAHLVHYPVRGGSGVNIVAIVTDTSEAQGWSRAGERERLLARFAHWAPQPRSILSAPTAWQVWSLFDLPPLPHLGAGPVTLLGDAAHAALPFLAQGAAMAIEDAAVLTDCLENRPDDIETAFRNYETMRQSRTARVAQESARMATIYHHGPLLAAARNFVMRRTGGERLALRQDWLYRWPN
jgi:salicylate hydroxylase